MILNKFLYLLNCQVRKIKNYFTLTKQTEKNNILQSQATSTKPISNYFSVSTNIFLKQLKTVSVTKRNSLGLCT